MNGKYRAYTLALMVMICVIIGFTFMMSASRLEDIYKEQTLLSIQETKKDFLKDSVSNLITDIDALRLDRTEHYAGLVNETSARFERMEDVTEEMFISIVTEYFDEQRDATPWTAIIWNQQLGVAVYNTSNLKVNSWEEILAQITEGLAAYQIVQYEGYQMLLGIEQEAIDREVKLLIHDRVHQMSFSEGGYIWVNEITNFEGGDGYAFRVIHPNLPETEGMLLSTEMTDIKGKYVYLAELIGIKAEGEVYNTYYFKKLDSEEVAKKLSYSKLYVPYNWAIGMGMYLDDLQSFTDKTNAESRALASRLILTLILFFTFVVLIGFGIQISIERRSFLMAKSQLENDANRDVLTGVFNRRYGTMVLNASFEDFKKLRHSTMIMMFDIDLFKQINDTYGHDFGDEVLISVSKSLQILIRSTDTYIRWGGDEFIIIFAGLQPEMAEVVCHKVIDQISAIHLSSGKATVNPSVSIGCSFFSIADKDFQDALKRADEAMYQSKSEGRGRFTVIRG